MRYESYKPSHTVKEKLASCLNMTLLPLPPLFLKIVRSQIIQSAFCSDTGIWVWLWPSHDATEDRKREPWRIRLPEEVKWVEIVFHDSIPASSKHHSVKRRNKTLCSIAASLCLLSAEVIPPHADSVASIFSILLFKILLTIIFNRKIFFLPNFSQYAFYPESLKTILLPITQIGCRRKGTGV